MADPVSRLSCEDEHFELFGLMSDEMAHVKSWTGIKNRAGFYDALREEDPDAVNAAFTLARRRKGEPGCMFRDVRVNLDALRWSRHIDMRDVELAMELDSDGDPLVVQVNGRGEPLRDPKGGYLEPTGEEGERTGLVPLRNTKGGLCWRFIDTGEDADPTNPPVTSGSTGSPSTATKRTRSGSASGTRKTAAS